MPLIQDVKFFLQDKPDPCNSPDSRVPFIPCLPAFGALLAPLYPEGSSLCHSGRSGAGASVSPSVCQRGTSLAGGGEGPQARCGRMGLTPPDLSPHPLSFLLSLHLSLSLHHLFLLYHICTLGKHTFHPSEVLHNMDNSSSILLIIIKYAFYFR